MQARGLMPFNKAEPRRARPALPSPSTPPPPAWPIFPPARPQWASGPRHFARSAARNRRSLSGAWRRRGRLPGHRLPGPSGRRHPSTDSRAPGVDRLCAGPDRFASRGERGSHGNGHAEPDRNARPDSGRRHALAVRRRCSCRSRGAASSAAGRATGGRRHDARACGDASSDGGAVGGSSANGGAVRDGCTDGGAVRDGCTDANRDALSVYAGSAPAAALSVHLGSR